MPNYEILGIASSWVKLGAFREELLKPLIYILTGILIILAILIILQQLAVKNGFLSAQKAKLLAWVILAAVIAFWLIAALSPGLLEYMTLSRFSLDANHLWIAVIIFLISITVITQKANDRTKHTEKAIRKLSMIFIMTGVFSGLLMLLKIGGLSVITRLAYTSFDLSLVFMAFTSVVSFLLRMITVKESIG